MAPIMTPFPLRKPTTVAADLAGKTRWHTSKIITTIIITILLLKCEEILAEDAELSSILRHRYDDNENSIYRDENDINSSSSSSNSSNSSSSSTTYANVTKNPEIFACPAEGLYAHNNECQSYYRCETQTNGYIKAYLLNCKQGTIFSRDLKLCMPAVLVNREECQQYTNEIDTLATDDYDVALGGDSNRQSVYYSGNVVNSAVGGTDGSVESRLNYVLNEARVKGGIANNSNAMDGAYKHWKNDELKGLRGVSVISFSTSSARSAGVGSSSSSSSSTDNDQGPPCEDDGFISSPDDCTVFYRCISNGQSFNKIGFRCSEGTAWDNSLKLCNTLLKVRAAGGCESKQGIKMDVYGNQQTSTQSSQMSFQNSTMSSTSSQQNSTSSSSSFTSSSATSSSSQQSSSTENSSTSTSLSTVNANIESSSNQNSNSTSQISNNEQISNSDTNFQNSSSISQGNEHSNSNQHNMNSNTIITGSSSQNNINQNSIVHDNNQSVGNETSFQSFQNSNQQNISSSNTNNSQSSSSNLAGNHNFIDQLNSSGLNNTSSKPSVAECVDDNTYLSDKNDCAKFYRCRNNGKGGLEAVPFTCGPGTIWNQDNKVCDLPTNSQREKCKAFLVGEEQNLTSENQAENSLLSSNNNDLATSSNNESASSSAISNSSNSQSEHQTSNTDNNNLNSSVVQSIESISQSASSSSTINQSGFSHNQSNNSSSSNNQSGSSNNQYNSSNIQSNANNESISSNNEPNQFQSSTSSTNLQLPGAEQQSKPQKVTNPNGKCQHSETYLQDKYDCVRFYRCVVNGNGGFDIVAFNCAPGTIWDNDSKTCKYPTNSQTKECKKMSSASKPISDTYQSSSITSNQSAISNQQVTSTNNQSLNSNSNSLNNNNQIHNQLSNLSSSSSQSESQISTTTSESIQSSATTGSLQSSSLNNQSQVFNNDSSSSTSTSSNNNQSNSSSISSSSSQQVSNLNNQESSSSTITEYSNSSTTSTQNQESSSSSLSQSSNIQTETTQTHFKPPIYCESEETFLQDKTDCNKFYRCVNDGKGGFNKVSFKCPPNTIWNPPANSCDHPAKVHNLNCTMTTGNNQNSTSSINQGSDSNEGTESSGSQSSGSIHNQVSSSTQSSESTISSNNQSNTLNSTISSTLQQSSQSSLSQSSSLSSNNHSLSTSSLTTIEESLSNESTGSTAQELISDSSTQTSLSSMQQNLPYTCKSNNQYLEDYTDCAKFHRCVKNSKGGYNIISFTCGPGTVWDSEIIGCNHAWAVKNKNCSTSSNLESASETHSGTNQTTTKPTTKRPHSITSIKPSEQKPTTPTATTILTIMQPTTPKITSTPKPIVQGTVPTKYPIQSHSICKSSGFIQDPNDCSRFYRCVENANGGFTQYAFKCSKGTIWDNDLQTCNHDLNKCNPNTNEDSGTTQKPIGYLPSSEKPEETTATPTNLSNNPEQQKPTTIASGYYPTTHFTEQPTIKPVHESTIQPVQQTMNEKPGYHPTTESTTKNPAYNTTSEALQVTNTFKPSYKPTTEYPQTTNKYPNTTISGSYTQSTTLLFTTTTKPSANEPMLPSDKCSKEGFFPDRQDCQKFYRCIDRGNGSFEKHFFKCGVNTVWDAEIASCNHPSYATDLKCNRESPTILPINSITTYKPTSLPTESIHIEDLTTTSKPTSTTPIPNLPPGMKCQGVGFMADPLNCRKFYRCIYTSEGYKQYEFKCAKNTAWSEKSQTCDHWDNVDRCQNHTYEPDKETTTVEYTTYKPTTPETNGKPASTAEYDKSTTEISTTETQKPTLEPSMSPSMVPSSIIEQSTTLQPSTGHVPNLHSGKNCKGVGFMADPEDCQKFYRCDKISNGYYKHEFTCAKGTGWNEGKQTCDHKENIDRCRGQTEEPETSTMKYTTNTPLSSTVTDMPIPTTLGPTTTTFSTSTSTEKTTNPYSTTANINKTELITTSEPTPATSIANLPSGKDCNGEGFMADPDNCRKFYRCEKNGNGYLKHRFICGSGTGWNEEKQTCDHKDNISRCLGQTEEAEIEATTMESTSIAYEKPTTTTNGYDNPTSSSNCEKPATTTDFQNSTPTATTPHVTTTIQYTTIQTTSTASIQNLPPGTTCQGEGFMADPNNCRKFYRCEKRDKGYNKYEFICAKGTGWSEESQTCDHSVNIHRCLGQTEETELETTTMEYITSEATSTAPTSTTTTNFDKPSSSFETTTMITQKPSLAAQTTESTTADYTVPNLPAGKRCSGEGFMADPDNCRKFYRCVMANGNDGKFEQHAFMCGKGTAWSEELQTCDHTANVKRCEGHEEDIETSTHALENTTYDPYNPVTTTTTVIVEQSTENPEYLPTATTLPTINAVGETTTIPNPTTTTKMTTSHPSTLASSDKPSYETTTTTSTNTEEFESNTIEPANFTCTSEGFFVDGDDCSRYYRCVDADKSGNYQIYSFHCPNGTVWDTSVETCNYADKVSANCTSGISTEYPSSIEETTTNDSKGDSTTEKPETTTTEIPEISTIVTPSTSETPKDTTNNPEPTSTEISMDTTAMGSSETTTTESSKESTIIHTSAITTTEHSEPTSTMTTSLESTTSNKPLETTEEAYNTTSTIKPDTTTVESTSSDNPQETSEQSYDTTSTIKPDSTTLESTTSDNPQETSEQSYDTTSTIKPGSTTVESTTSDNPQETSEQSYDTTSTIKPDSTTLESTTSDNPQETSEESYDTTSTIKPDSTTLESTTSDNTQETSEEPDDTTTTTQFETESTAQPETASNSTSPCPSTSEGQNLYICPTGFRRHPKHCNMFYQCTEKVDSYDQSIVVFKCPDGTVYHEYLNRCDVPKSGEECFIQSRIQTVLFEEEHKHSRMIQIRSTAPLCPNAGHFALNNDECSQVFIRCQYSSQTLQLEGQIFRCPKDFTYWSISRRCERTQKLQNCAKTQYNVPSSLPVEWLNIGNRRRNLIL